MITTTVANLALINIYINKSIYRTGSNYSVTLLTGTAGTTTSQIVPLVARTLEGPFSINTELVTVVSPHQALINIYNINLYLFKIT